MRKDHTRRYKLDIISYAQKYCGVLLDGDASPLLVMPNGKRRAVMASLSNLAKFLGVYGRWKSLIAEYRLSWSAGNRDQLIIDRLTKVRCSSEIFEWIREVKRARPDFCCFMDLMAVTGLRMVEAVNSYNLIVHLSGEDRLDEYYSVDSDVLEHYRFRELFLRKSKKAFVSFVPRELVDDIVSCGGRLHRDMIASAVKRSNLPNRFSDVRELHGTLMTRHLKPSEIDFLHGRVGKSVFMTNYFNPALISDLKSRVFKGIAEIQKKIAV